MAQWDCNTESDFFFLIETVSYASQAGLEFAMKLRMTLIFFSCINLASIGIISMYHNTWFMQVLEVKGKALYMLDKHCTD